MEEMEEQGIIGQSDGPRPREVLVSSMDAVFGSVAGIDQDDADLGARIPEPTDSRDDYLTH